MADYDQARDRGRRLFHWWELAQLPWSVVKRVVVAVGIGGVIGLTGLDHVIVYIIWAVVGSFDVWLMRGEGARYPWCPQVVVVPTPFTAIVLNITHLLMVYFMWHLQRLYTT